MAWNLSLAACGSDSPVALCLFVCVSGCSLPERRPNSKGAKGCPGYRTFETQLVQGALSSGQAHELAGNEDEARLAFLAAALLPGCDLPAVQDALSRFCRCSAIRDGPWRQEDVASLSVLADLDTIPLSAMAAVAGRLGHGRVMTLPALQVIMDYKNATWAL